MSKLDSKGDNLDILKEAAKTVYPDNQVLADLSVVQAILEGACLKNPPSMLGLVYNNLFGVKGSGTGLLINKSLVHSVSLNTHEFYNGAMHEVKQSFAVNASIEDSFEQHKKLLELPRYVHVLNAKSFTEAATAIRQAGYATDPSYTKLLLNIYDEYLDAI